MTELDTDILADLIAKKHTCLEQMRELGQRQRAMVESDDMTGLLRMLAARGHLIELLRAIEQQLGPFRTQSREQRTWRSAADRRRCAAQAEACEQLLAQILNEEKQSERRLAQRRDEAAARLEGAQAADQARSAYLAPEKAASGTLDISSESTS